MKFNPPKPLQTSILFLIYKRLTTTKQVFNQIRKAKPPKLYIAADGPRENVPDEIEKVKEVREYVLNNIDWECEVKTLFRKKNLGCGKAVSEAITWFFNNEEMGIILEDDTLPALSFFWFCEELLHKYKNDLRIGQICGFNLISKKININDSYTFSKYKSSWGWATWRRAWEYMDFEMKWLNSNYKDLIIWDMSYSKISVKHWEEVIKKIKNKEVDTWDWQWGFSISTQGQLTIFPKKNLIANIGFGSEATHTLDKPPLHFIKNEDIDFPLKHPNYIVQNFFFDKIFENEKYKIKLYKKILPLFLKRLIKKILNYE